MTDVVYTNRGFSLLLVYGTFWLQCFLGFMMLELLHCQKENIRLIEMIPNLSKGNV